MSEIYIPNAAKCYFACQKFIESKKNILLIYATEEEAAAAWKQANFFLKSNNSSIYFPSLDSEVYDRISPSSNILAERAKVLSSLILNNNQNKLIITHAINLMQLLPPKEFFSSLSLDIAVGMKYNATELSKFLVNNGFNRVSTAN